MRCVESTEISALIDGELDTERRQMVAGHIVECDECRDEKERLLALSTLLFDTSSLETPRALDERVTQAYRARYARPKWTDWLWARRLAVPIPMMAAALLITVAAAFGAYKAGQANSQQIVIASEPAVMSPPMVAPGVEITSQPAVVAPATEIEPRIVTRIVNVCRSGRRLAQPRPFQPVTPIPKSPVLTATMTDNGYFTDLRLAGFEPPAELNAQIIKGVKK